MQYELTDDYLADARQRAYRYQGQWTGTAGSLAADVARLLLERKRMQGTITDLEETNSQLREAVENRMAGRGSMPTPDQLFGGGCCDGGKCQPTDDPGERWKVKAQASSEKYHAHRLTGDSLLTASDVHPTSQAYFDLLDKMKALHASKSRDYGSETDPLANIRSGAEFVGIEPFKGAMVRLSDKVTRLATFNRTGSLHHEGVEDTLLDLASYSLLALLLYQEDHND
jgi:hypothetical protein